MLQIILDIPPATMLEGEAVNVFITGGVGADGGEYDGVGDEGGR